MAKVLDDLDVQYVLNANTGPQRYFLGEESRGQRVARKRKQLAEVERLVRIHVKPHCNFDLFAHQQVKEEYACEHCGSKWTEASDAYNGGCCAKDEEANPHPEGEPVFQLTDVGGA